MKQPHAFRQLLNWVALPLLVGLVTGLASALFLTGLGIATHLQTSNDWLLWLLPFGGAIISYIYWKYGQESARGNNLVLEQIHTGDGNVPLRMAPLVLIGTWITHLFGGSAGREGTAVQMGGSLSGELARRLGLQSDERRLLVLCGISGGFGSVFGTPLAGALFALEAATRGKSQLRNWLGCLLAAYGGHWVATGVGIRHSHFEIGAMPALTAVLLFKLLLASAAFGWTAWLFVRFLHLLKSRLSAWIVNPIVRSFAGGAAIIALVYLIGTRDYLGLGLPLLEQSFQESAAPPDIFLWKLAFTVMTLGAGFIGGEVTPLLVIGATLGSALSDFLMLPAPFLAALGLAAVFGAAAKTPLACAAMGMELFGFHGAGYFLLVCALSRFASGNESLYESHIRMMKRKTSAHQA